MRGMPTRNGAPRSGAVPRPDLPPDAPSPRVILAHISKGAPIVAESVLPSRFLVGAVLIAVALGAVVRDTPDPKGRP